MFTEGTQHTANGKLQAGFLVHSTNIICLVLVIPINLQPATLTVPTSCHGFKPVFLLFFTKAYS